jgi:glucokinase
MLRVILAADVGGTKTYVGLYQRLSRPRVAAPVSVFDERPRSLLVREYPTLEFESLDAIVGTFAHESSARDVEAIAIGVAGPVSGLTARLTNVPWIADAVPIARRFGNCPARLLNDLEAMAYSVPVLEPDELAVLQEGEPIATGNAALIAAGTGLGEALLHNVGGRFIPSASEGGHADFAARTPRELALVADLARLYGRVDNERVLSGPGLVNLYHFTHGKDGPRSSSFGSSCPVDPDAEPAELPAEISAAALERRCSRCEESLDMFVQAYGAEAGNLALRGMATAGVYLGGGIAPKILPALETGVFIDAFCDKPPLADLLRTLPVSVILNPTAGLIGAAVAASAIARVS